MNPFNMLSEKIGSKNLWKKELLLKRNAYLKVKGSIDTNSYFVEKSSLRILVIDENEESTIRFGYQGDFIATLDSFITEEPFW